MTEFQMPMPIKKLASLLILLAVASCATTRVDDNRAIDDVYRNFIAAYSALDADGAARQYENDALYLRPDSKEPVLRGREAIAPTFRSFLGGARDRKASLKISFRIIDRTISGHWAYDVGYYRLVSSSPSEPPRTGAGKIITVLHRQPDGTWKFHVDTFSAAPLEAFDAPGRLIE